MRRSLFLLAPVLSCALLLSVSSVARAQTARHYIDSALMAIGGREALLALKSQRIISHGENFEPEQTVRPGAEPRKVSTFSCTLMRDVSSGRLRYEWQRETLYPFALTWKYTELLNGDFGAIIGTDGARSPAKRPASAAWLPPIPSTSRRPVSASLRRASD